MEVMTIKDMAKEEITYLLNAIGETTGNGKIPGYVNKWYDEVIEDTEWLQYLVKYNDQYGILALWEIDHPTSESWNDSVTGDQDRVWKSLSGAQIWFRLNRYCEKIQEILDLDVMLGKKTGIFEQHELAFFIPIDTSKDEYKSKFESIANVEIVNI